MSEPDTIFIESIPEDAMETFQTFAKTRDVHPSIIINWCIIALGFAYYQSTVGTEGRFYWQPKGTKTEDAEELPSGGIWGGAKESITIILRNEAHQAMSIVQKARGCSKGDVLAYAAHLASCFERPRGRLIYGYIKNGRFNVRYRVVKIQGW